MTLLTTDSALVMTPEPMIVAHITKIEVFSGGLWMLGNTDENPRAYRRHPQQRWWPHPATESALYESYGELLALQQSS
jgi:hypothetical protein